MRIIPEWKDYDAEIKALLDGKSKRDALEGRNSDYDETTGHNEL